MPGDVLQHGLQGTSETEKLHALFRRGEALPSQVAERILDALGGGVGSLNIFAAVNASDVRAQAAESDAR